MHFASAFFGQYLKADKDAAQYLSPALPGFKPRTTVGVRLESK
jgi:hypothetical protein